MPFLIAGRSSPRRHGIDDALRIPPAGRVEAESGLNATPHLRRTAMRLLLDAAGGERATSEDLAAASARLLERLSVHLAQVIGGVGFEALWLRAVKLRQHEFPFLDERLLSRDPASPGETLRLCLQEQQPDAIREAWKALFGTVASLLATVIGDRLTWILLQSAWPETHFSDADPRETET